jgi:hypothetical protein
MNEKMKKADARKYYCVLTPDSARIVQGKDLMESDFKNTVVSKGFGTMKAAREFEEQFLFTDPCILDGDY